MASPTSAPPGFFEVSLDSSRRFNGLKVWASLQHLGKRGLARIIDRQIELARALADRLGAEPGIELAHSPLLNIVCFRRTLEAECTEAWLNEHQERFREEVEREAGSWLTTTTLDGRSFLRANLLHFGIRREHAERLADAVSELCGRVRTRQGHT